MQVSALQVRHEDIAYKGGRLSVGKILAHIGLVQRGDPRDQERQVNRIIADQAGLFHFGSLIRCTVERRDADDGWTGTGGDMLGAFIATPFGAEIASTCAERFLKDLPRSTKLVVMFGMGKKQNYVQDARKLISKARGTYMRTVNDIAYEDDHIVVVHVEHFKSQGNLIPKWLGEGEHAGDKRARFGRMAREAVGHALSR